MRGSTLPCVPSSRGSGVTPPPPESTAAPRRTERPKLAEVIAERIEGDIVARGWAVGEVVGSEAQLLEKYGVSRAVLREAVRIVEHHFVATMRRGPHGGLLVTEPDIGAIVRAITLQLQFERIEPSQLYEARIALELGCAREAAERITPEGVERLKAFLDEEAELGPADLRSRSHDLHILIGELTGNPALRLFVDVLVRLTMQQAGYPSSQAEFNEVGRAHLRIGEALIARDPDAAERRMHRHLLALTEWLRANPAGTDADGEAVQRGA
jgi:DNA-binding FadR family transcriptional regulator